MEIFGMAVITSLLAGALISNLGSISTIVFAQDSQNATQQTAGIWTWGLTELHTKPKNVDTGIGFEYNIIIPWRITYQYNNSPMALILSNSLKG